MNTVDYVREAYRQLADTNSYKLLDQNPTQRYNDEINQLLANMLAQVELDNKTYTCLINNNPRTPQFYLLLKIHTTGAPGRPIMRANGCTTENISGLGDAILRDFVPNCKYYIKDTTHFIKLVENIPVDDQTILFTLDASSFNIHKHPS
jgi:hypothetical protein